MRYKASWRYTSGFGISVMIIGICLLLAGILFKETVLVAIGGGSFLYLLLIGKRLHVELLPDRLVYQGWFKKTDVGFGEVLSVRRALDLAWPRNRIYGPLTYEIRTSAGRLLINLLYFGPEFSRKFQELFVSRTVKPEREMEEKKL